jgi:hypothetical protein
MTPASAPDQVTPLGFAGEEILQASGALASAKSIPERELLVQPVSVHEFAAPLPCAGTGTGPCASALMIVRLSAFGRWQEAPTASGRSPTERKNNRRI